MSKIGHGIVSRHNAEQYDMKNNVAEWVDLIAPHNPAYFCTFATQHTLTLNSARTAMSVFARKLRGLMTEEEKLFFFWVAERFECKDGYHTHALLSVPDTLKVGAGFKSLRESSSQAFGTKKIRTQFSPMRKQVDGVRYCTKYVSKANADWDIHATNGIIKNTIPGIIEAFREQQISHEIARSGDIEPMIVCSWGERLAA